MSPRSLLFLVLLLPFLSGNACDTAPPFPDLSGSTPGDGGTVARTAWPVLDFAAAVNPASLRGATLFCDDALVGSNAALLDADSVVVQPRVTLPAGASCELAFATTSGAAALAFSTAAAGTPFVPRYDRRDADQPLPFPDDFFLVAEPANPTGFALDVVLPGTTGTAGNLLRNIEAVARADSDGWSPIGNWTLELSAAADASSVPADDRTASLDPLATIALIDLTPGSPTEGQRVPFKLIVRSDSFPPEPVSHSLFLSPGIALRPEGTYGVVVTDRVLNGAGEPLGRSAFFEAVAAPATAGEDAEITAARPLAEEVLAAAEALSPVPIPRGDVVAAVRMTIRSLDHIPDDVFAMRADVLTTSPDVQIDSVVAAGGANAAIVRGTFQVPDWGTPFVNRGVDGLPAAVGTQRIDFILSLPDAAETPGHAPVLMYQHGSPGSAEGEVPSASSEFLAGAGFAVGGFTDPLNRLAPTQDEANFAILGNVLINGEAPDFYIQLYAEQMAFVRALESLATLDVLPLGAPDGVPDLDPSTLVYEGISYGSNHAQAFLAYEPKIRAAALVAGAVRFAELIEHQDRTAPFGVPLIRGVLGGFLTGVRAPDFWMTLSLFAVTYDRQDPHNHARFIYREPFVIDGTTRRASILQVEGIDDSYTANNASRSLAIQLGGIPQTAPVLEPVIDLSEVPVPVQGNIDAETTAAMVQYGSQSPGCFFAEGHFCAQTTPSARAQRVDFYQSALVGVPVIDE